MAKYNTPISSPMSGMMGNFDPSGAITKLKEILGGVSKPFAALGKDVEIMAKAIHSIPAQLLADVTELKKLGAFFKSLPEKLGADLEALKQTRVGKAGMALAAAPGQAQQAGMKGLSTLVSTLSAPIAAVQQAAGLIQQFVGSFDPSAMTAFSLALRDAQAVIGKGLQPVMYALTQGLKMVASIMLPLMDPLNKALAQLSDVILEVFDAFADLYMGVQIEVIVTLVQVLAEVAKVFTLLTPILRAGTVLFMGLFNGLKALIEGIFGSMNLSDTMDSFKEAIQGMVKYAMLAVASFAKMIGWTSFIDGMIKGAGGNRKDATGVGAASNARFAGIGETGKSLMTAAFIATGGSAPKKQEDYMKELVDGLKEIKEGEGMVAKIEEAIDHAVDKVIAAIKGAAYQGAKDVGNGILDTLNPISHVKAIGGLFGL